MFGYQGQERVSNGTNEVAGSRWYNFNLRMYNPSLGRFNTIDPYSQFNSPYLAMANNPISFVDPDGGRSVENDQTKAAREKARREFKEWWAENGNSFRHRGAVNLFYHESNLATFGRTDFDALDLNQKGWDGSVWSGRGNGGWGPVMKDFYGVDSYDMREIMSGQSSVAITQTMDDIASQQFGAHNGKWNAIKQFAQEVVDNNGELVFDENGNVIGYTTLDITTETYQPMAGIFGGDVTANGKIYRVGEERTRSFSEITFHKFDLGSSNFADKYKADGDFWADLQLYGGMAVGGFGNIVNYGANYNGGTKVGGKFLTREVNAGKLFSKIGLGFKVLGIAGSIVSAESATEKYVNSDRSYGQAGQLAVNLIGNTLTNLKHPTLIGIGIAFELTDYYGGFNSSYRELDRIEQTEHNYLNLFYYLNGYAAFLK